MLQGEHSAILSTCIKLPFVIKIFVLSIFEWLLKTDFTVLTTYMYFWFCGICRLTVRWIFLLQWDFFTPKKDWSTAPAALKSDGPYFEIMGQWPGPTINLKACKFYLSDIKVCLSWTSDNSKVFSLFPWTEIKKLTLNAPIATKVVCFSRLPKCLRSL